MPGELETFGTLAGITQITGITPLSLLRAIALCKPGTTFTNAEGFATLATWKAKIASKDIFIIDEIVEEEDISVPDGIYSTPMGQQIDLGIEGMRGKKLMVKLTLDQHKLLRQYSNLGWEVIKIDRGNRILGVKNDDGTIQGFDLATFIVQTQTPSATDKPPLTTIIMQEDDPGEYNDKGFFIKPTWRVKNIKPLTMVTIVPSTVVGTPTFTFTATVAYNYTSEGAPAGTVKSIPISGLVQADFTIIDQGGAAETCTVTESTVTPGTYTFVGVNITSGSIKVLASATNLFESLTTALVAAT